MELSINKYAEIFVSVICTAYNHESYIKDALEGFVMQKTNFKFEVIVHDDASTDSTAEIIKEYEDKYPHLFANIYQKHNLYSRGIGDLVRIVFGAVRGKYIAYCEGDDYWIDPYKLQKQVDFLESNPDFGFVYSKAYLLSESEKKIISTFGNKNSKIDKLIYANVLPTCTTLYRRELFNKFMEEVQPLDKGWIMLDFPIVMWFSINCKIHFINEELGVYRIHGESASNSKNVMKNIAFAKGTTEIRQYFASIMWPGNTAIQRAIIGREIRQVFLTTTIAYRYSLFEDYIANMESNGTVRFYKGAIKIFKAIPQLKYLFSIYYRVLSMIRNMRFSLQQKMSN